MSKITRKTRETEIAVEFPAQAAVSTIETTVPFLDHMLTTLARYSGHRLVVKATGDLPHHLIEDVAIALGAAVADERERPIERFGHQVIPMDDALVEAALDLGGRAYYRGPIPSSLYDHWMRSFAENAGATLHIRVLRGQDRHHIVEAAFKALGRALGQALAAREDTMSTKGAVRLA
jgi:imidazoleglycerol-phosphate dehydratase